MSKYLYYRRLAQAAEWALLALIVFLYAGGWLFCYYPLLGTGAIGRLLADSLPFATLLLLASWCNFGPGYVWVRGVVAVALVVACTAAMTTTWHSSHARIFFGTATHTGTLLGLAPLTTLVCAAVLRLNGLRAQKEQESAHARGATFTIAGLLAATTAIAAIIGSLEAARPSLQGADADAFRMALATALFTALALLAYAATLRPHAVWMRLAGLTLLIPAAGWYIGNLTDTHAETLTLWAATITAIVAGSLVPLRLMGYRLIRPIPQCPPIEVQP